VIIPYNLHIIDYVIGVPESAYNSAIFSKAQIACQPKTFFDGYEWLWIDLAYDA